MAIPLVAVLDFLKVDSIWPALAALVAGLLFILAEVFIPSHGILSILAVLSVVASLIMAGHLSTFWFVFMVLLVVVLLPTVIGLGLRIWPHTFVGKRIFLEKPQADDVPSHTKAAGIDLQRYVGAIGKTLTPLRPSGFVEIDGRRIDTLSEGTMVEAGQYVRVLAVRGTAVIVRPLEPHERPGTKTA